MNAIHMLRCLSLGCFFFLAAQGGFYMLAQSRVMRELRAADFRHIRQLTDAAVGPKLKLLYPGTLLLLTALLIVETRQQGLLLSSGTALALLLLLADFLLAIVFSIPLNKLIFRTEDPALQVRWISMMSVRGYLCVAGFMILMAAPWLGALWRLAGER